MGTIARFISSSGHDLMAPFMFKHSEQENDSSWMLHMQPEAVEQPRQLLCDIRG